MKLWIDSEFRVNHIDSAGNHFIRSKCVNPKAIYDENGVRLKHLEQPIKKNHE